MSVFNPNDHMMQLKSKEGNKDYLPVQWRLVWFRQQCPEGEISTEMVHLDLDRETEEEGYAWNQETRRSEKIVKRANGIAIFRAVVKDGKGGIATATKSEKAASFGDYIEKAETGAVGRALAMLGYGTQFSADELDEAHRIADAPVDRSNNNPASQNTNRPTASSKPLGASTPTTTTTQEGLNISPATDQQRGSIHKLCEALGKPMPLEELTYQQAKDMLTQLSKEYNENKQSRKAS